MGTFVFNFGEEGGGSPIQWRDKTKVYRLVGLSRVEKRSEQSDSVWSSFPRQTDSERKDGGLTKKNRYEEEERTNASFCMFVDWDWPSRLEERCPR